MKLGLTAKLILPFVTILLVSLALLATVFSVMLSNALSSSLLEKSKIVVLNLSMVLSDQLAASDSDRMEQTLHSASKVDRDLAYLLLVSTDGQVLASTDATLKGQRLASKPLERAALTTTSLMQRATEDPDVFELDVAVKVNDTSRGILRVGVTTQYTHQAQITMIVGIVALGLVSVLVGIVAYWQLTRKNILDPLAQLATLFRRVSQGDLSTRMDSVVESDDEVGQLLLSVQSMVDYLRAMAHAADVVASGDLEFNVVPRSQADKFGHAFREMVESLRKILRLAERSGISVTGATTSLAAMAKQQEASISEQVATSTEISATCREISATARELVNTMDRVAGEAEATSGLAEQGRVVLNRMQVAMDQTVEGAGTISTKLTVLNQKANKIGSVVTTIARVADQTNLLSLNAAIEAEKAGEYGRGFAVVATEIRRLADQTAVATLDIEHMIRGVQGAISSGVMDMDKFTVDVREGAEAAREVVEQLGEIVARVQAMSTSFEQVNYGMKSQALGAEQITESVRQLGEAAAQSAASIHDINCVIANLCEATQGLADAVVTQRKDLRLASSGRLHVVAAEG